MLIINTYKAFRKITELISNLFYVPISKTLFYLNGASIGSGMKCKGIPKVIVTRRGKLEIGKNFKFNSGNNHNIIGRQQKCIFWVEGKVKIGNNVGMSATAIICNYEIIIGDNVLIGGNTVIYDTDFHSLDTNYRNTNHDKDYAKKATVKIEDNVFIGAHTTILKGVSIGANSIIGACSVVTKSIPPNEIWAGNPIRFIKKIR